MKKLIILPFLFVLFGFGFMTYNPYPTVVFNYGAEFNNYITEFEKENKTVISSLSVQMKESLPDNLNIATCTLKKDSVPTITVSREKWEGLNFAQKKEVMTAQLNCAVFRKITGNGFVARN